MKVKILVEFEIEAKVDIQGKDFDNDALNENVCKSAASMAAWNNVCLTANGQDVTKEVEVHVDGFGKCKVKIGEEHE